MNDKEQLAYQLDRDAKMLEAKLNLVVDSMTIGEIKQHLKETDKLETYLEKNVIKLAQIEELEENNTKLEEF